MVEERVPNGPVIAIGRSRRDAPLVREEDVRLGPGDLGSGGVGEDPVQSERRPPAREHYSKGAGLGHRLLRPLDDVLRQRAACRGEVPEAAHVGR